MKFSRARAPLSLLGLLLAGCTHRETAALRAVPPESSLRQEPAFAEKIKVRGISDAGKVNDHLFRGSQPDARGIRELKQLGITTIVDLRGERQGTVQVERKRAGEVGINLINIHASGWSPPTDEQLAQFFSVLQKQPRETFYIHCWLGDDRTGVFLAAYRIALEHWTPQHAMDEMYFFGFKGFWHPSMKAFIRAFPARFAASPAFAAFRQTAAKEGDH